MNYSVLPPLDEPLGGYQPAEEEVSLDPDCSLPLGDDQPSLHKVVPELSDNGIPLNRPNVSTALGHNPKTSGMSASERAEITKQLKSGYNQDVRNRPNAFTEANSLSRASARGDPILGYEWIAVIIDRGNPAVIEPVYIESISTPSISFEQKVVFRDGSNYNYAGTKSVGPMTIALHNDDTGRAFKLASSWFESVYDSQSGTYRVPSSYKKTVKLFVHDAARGVVAAFYFLGVWPSSWNGGNWDQSSDPTQVILTLSVDRMYVLDS